MSNYINKMRLGVGNVINPSDTLNQSLRSITDLLSRASAIDNSNKELALRKKESESKLLTDMLQQKVLYEQYQQAGGDQEPTLQKALKEAPSTSLFDDKAQISMLNRLYERAKTPEDVEKLNKIVTAGGTRNDWSFLTKVDKDTATNNMTSYLISKGVNPIYAAKIAPTYATKFTQTTSTPSKEQIDALTAIIKQDPFVTDKTTKEVGNLGSDKSTNTGKVGFLSSTPYTVSTNIDKWLDSIGISNSFSSFSGEKKDIPFIIRDFNKKVHEYTGRYPSEAAIKSFILENLDQGTLNNTTLDSRNNPKAFSGAIKSFLERNKEFLFSTPIGNSRSKREVTTKKYSDEQKKQIAQAKETLFKSMQPSDPLTRLLTNLGVNKNDLDFLFKSDKKSKKTIIPEQIKQTKTAEKKQKAKTKTNKRAYLFTDKFKPIETLKLPDKQKAALLKLLEYDSSEKVKRLQRLINRYSKLGNTQAVEQLRVELEGLQ